MTQPKSEAVKARAAFGRAFRQGAKALPATLRRNWRNVLMPWRMLSTPVALALIGLVALAMVLPAPGDANVDAATVGGTVVPATLHCAEDEVIALDGVPDTLFCVHIENVLDNGR